MAIGLCLQMIAAEVPVLFAKACEMFSLELTLCSWSHMEENKQRTLQRNDIAGAITRGDIFDFLVDIVPQMNSRMKIWQYLGLEFQMKQCRMETFIIQLSLCTI
jgi:nuclear transcription factor Y gamma